MTAGAVKKLSKAINCEKKDENTEIGSFWHAVCAKIPFGHALDRAVDTGFFNPVAGYIASA